MKSLESVKRSMAKGALVVMAGATSLMAEIPALTVRAGVSLTGSKESDSGDTVASTVTGPMVTLINVILTIMAVVGVVMLVKAIMELVNAIQQQDNSGIFHAGRSIAVALLMVAIKPVVGLFVTGL